jgi:hypothetical protein
MVSTFGGRWSHLCSFVMSVAYVMSLKRLKGRNKITFYVFFTMIFVPASFWFITAPQPAGDAR